MHRDRSLPCRLPAWSKVVLGMAVMAQKSSGESGLALGYDGPGLRGGLRPGEHR